MPRASPSADMSLGVVVDRHTRLLYTDQRLRPSVDVTFDLLVLVMEFVVFLVT